MPGTPLPMTLDSLADGALAETEAVVEGDAESLIVLRQGNTVRAWFNICPHAGRRLDWAPGQFLRDTNGHLVCAAHGAAFDLASGQCVSGPCRGASLRAVAIEVDGNALVVLPDPA